MDDIELVTGKLHLPGEAQTHIAQAGVAQNDTVYVYVENNSVLNRQCEKNTYQFGPTIPGLGIDILFADGAIFSPGDVEFRWRRSGAQKQKLLALLETNPLSVLIALVMTPLVFWWIVTKGIPAAVNQTVEFIPQAIPDRMGEETLYMLDRLSLDKTALSAAEIARVRNLWQGALTELQLPTEKFALHFRASEQIGANALALPNGSVVITDDLVKLLGQHPQAMLSVLLHEIGHVEHRHSLKLVAQSLSTSILFAVFFGDIQGAGEMVLGASSSLLQNAFSREMEAQADAYSFDKLETLDISPAVFAEAMEALVGEAPLIESSKAEFPAEENTREHAETTEDTSQWMRYLSTHPMVKERIKAARQRGKLFSEKH